MKKTLLFSAAIAIAFAGSAKVVNHVVTTSVDDNAVQAVPMAQRFASVKEVSNTSYRELTKAELKEATSLPISYYERPKGTTYVGMSAESFALVVPQMYFPAFKEVDWTSLAFGAESFKWAYASGEVDSEGNDVMTEATTNVITTPKYDVGNYRVPALTATNSLGESVFTTVDYLYTGPFVHSSSADRSFLSTNLRPDAETIAYMGETVFNSADANSRLDKKFGLSAAGFTDVKLDGISELYFKPLRPYLLSQVVAHVCDTKKGAANINAQLVINRVELDEKDEVMKIGEKLCEATIECAVVANRQWQILNFDNLVYTDPETGRKKDLIIDDNILITIRPTDDSQFGQYLYASPKAWLYADPNNRWNLSTAYALVSAKKDGVNYLVPANLGSAYYMDDTRTSVGAMKSFPIQILAKTYYLDSEDTEMIAETATESTKTFTVNSYYSYSSEYWELEAVDAEGEEVEWVSIPLDDIKDLTVEYEGTKYYSGQTEVPVTVEALPAGVKGREAWVNISYMGASLSIHVVQGEAGVEGVAVNAPQVVTVDGDNFVVKANDNVAKAEVFTAAGQKVAEAAVNGTTTIDAAALANGLYIVKLDNGTTVKVVK